MKKIYILLITFLSLFAATVFAEITHKTTQKTSAFTSEQVKQIHQIIRDYLIQNPKILIEVSQALRIEQEKQMSSDAMKAIQLNKDALFNDKNSPFIGDSKAPITLVEFFDYQCGHCKAMSPILTKIMDANKNNIRVIFKELPIFGGMSKFSAKAALAANKQNKYNEFHNLLFTADKGLTELSVMELAKKAGLNVEKLKQDMNLPEVDKQIQDNFVLAQNLKIMGTPTFVITNAKQDQFRYIPGAASFEEIQKDIKSLQ